MGFTKRREGKKQNEGARREEERKRGREEEAKRGREEERKRGREKRRKAERSGQEWRREEMIGEGRDLKIRDRKMEKGANETQESSSRLQEFSLFAINVHGKYQRRTS